MASNIAAFEQQIDLDSYNEAWHGVELTWDQLTTPAVKK
jgi:hypothetical protein